jgi:hypothetical protein
MNTAPAERILRANTILYCLQWRSTVKFYRDVLGLAVGHETDGLIECCLSGQAYVSFADARRTSIPSSKGRGLTLSLQVPDLDRVRGRLRRNGIAVSAVKPVWEHRAC